MDVVRIVGDYAKAAELGAVRRGGSWWLGSVLCLSVRSVRGGAVRGHELVRVEDPEGWLDEELLGEVRAALAAQRGQLIRPV